MKNETVKEFLKELKSNPKAAELLKGKEAPKSAEEQLATLTDAAKALGYDLTAEDFSAFMEEQAAALKARTEAQVKGIQTLDDSEVSAVSGGEDHFCADTYKKGEFCFVLDYCEVLSYRYGCSSFYDPR